MIIFFFTKQIYSRGLPYKQFSAIIFLKVSFRSDIEIIGDSAESGCVLFDVVHLGDLRGGVSEEVGNLSGRECLDGTVRLPDSVHQISGECVP